MGMGTLAPTAATAQASGVCPAPMSRSPRAKDSAAMPKIRAETCRGGGRRTAIRPPAMPPI